MREKRRNQSEDSDTDVIGPALPQKVMLSHKELGTQLLPGEGEIVYICIGLGLFVKYFNEICRHSEHSIMGRVF